MNRITRRAAWWRLAAIGSLLSIALLAPRPSAAQPGIASCAAGYALWADGRDGDDTFTLSGSNSTVAGAVRSNAELRISGSNNSIAGATEYATLFEDGGDSNSYPTPRRTAASPPPVSYAIADYRPGGSAAAAAQSAGLYTVVNGDLDVSDTTTLSGLYYVTGDAKLSASDITGSFTIVAEGAIDVSGSSIRAEPYAGGLLLFANKREPGAAVIKLAGGGSELRGVIYGPGGTVELSGSDSSYIGAILGRALKLSGSSLSLRFAIEHCPGYQPPADLPQPYAPGEVVVKLFSAGDLAAVALANGLAPTPLGQFGARPIFRLAILDGSDPLAKAEQLRPAGGSGGDPRVEYAEPNYLAQTPEARKGRGSWVIGDGDGVGYAAQYAPATIRLAEAHGRSQGAGVTVAVLDTGVAPSHPALAGRLVPGFDFVGFDGEPWEENLSGAGDGYGHGTHVAGLVALAAPAAKIMPVRVLDENGVGNIWVLAEGLLFAAEQGPDGLPGTGDEAHVINLSLGTLRRTALLEDIVSDITCDDDDDDDDCDDSGGSGGVAVIVAAGNGGDTTPQYPAAESVAGSLAVGASTLDDKLAPFSTYGSWVRLAAPGAAVVSAVPGGGYETWSGTSMAAPLAAGVAALLRSAEPDLGPAALVERLVASGRAICGPVSSRLDAAAALGAPPAAPASCAAAAPFTVFLSMLFAV